MYGNQFLQFDFLFIIENTDEIAMTSINYTTAPGWTGAAAALGELTEDAFDALQQGMVDLLGPGAGGTWADYSTLTAIKASARGVDGLYLTDPRVSESLTNPSGTTGSLPPQCSTVISLRSGFTLGKGNYGRMFLPHHKIPYPAGEARASEAAAGAMAAQAVITVNQWTDAINEDTTAILFPAIMSQAAGTPSKGVTQIGVGRVVDTQRKRRNRLDEDAVLLPLA